jgi:hypothetical protein
MHEQGYDSSEVAKLGDLVSHPHYEAWTQEYIALGAPKESECYAATASALRGEFGLRLPEDGPPLPSER